MTASSLQANTQHREFTRADLAGFFICVGIVSLVLNWLWEMLQMSTYPNMAGKPFRETAARCGAAALGDVLVIFWIYALGALFTGNLSWGLKPRWNVYVASAFLAATQSFWIERAALGLGRWTYSQRMPIIPLLHVGLWPFLQLPFLTPLAFAISAYCISSKQRSSARISQHL